jgi:hypothetical protein
LRGGPGQGARGGGRAGAWWPGPGPCAMCYGGSSGWRGEESASEPSWRLAPRLDRREQDLPGARPHCIMSRWPIKGSGPSAGSVVVCSRVVTGVIALLIRRAAIAAWRAGWRRPTGGGSRPAGVIGPVTAGGRVGGSSSGVTGSVVGTGPGPRGKRRAWASAQLGRAKILRTSSVIGRVVTSGSGWRLLIPTGGFAVWSVAWRYGACSIARRGIGSGGGAGVGNG